MGFKFLFEVDDRDAQFSIFNVYMSLHSFVSQRANDFQHFREKYYAT